MNLEVKDEQTSSFSITIHHSLFTTHHSLLTILFIPLT